MAERRRPLADRLRGLRPSEGQPLRKADRIKDGFKGNKPFRAVGPSGNAPVWHGVTPTRYARPLPPSVKGPIPGREVRRQKGADGY